MRHRATRPVSMVGVGWRLDWVLLVFFNMNDSVHTASASAPANDSFSSLTCHHHPVPLAVKEGDDVYLRAMAPVSLAVKVIFYPCVCMIDLHMLHPVCPYIFSPHTSEYLQSLRRKAQLSNAKCGLGEAKLKPELLKKV